MNSVDMGKIAILHEPLIFLNFVDMGKNAKY
jgi:hypothetical protein